MIELFILASIVGVIVLVLLMNRQDAMARQRIEELQDEEDDEEDYEDEEDYGDGYEEGHVDIEIEEEGESHG